jgi:hypothetical protein
VIQFVLRPFYADHTADCKKLQPGENLYASLTHPAHRLYLTLTFRLWKKSTALIETSLPEAKRTFSFHTHPSSTALITPQPAAPPASTYLAAVVPATFDSRHPMPDSTANQSPPQAG